MEEKKATGIPVQEFTFGNVKATVWANKPVNGEVFLKVSLCRLHELPDGSKSYRNSFFPDDLGDLELVAARTAIWLDDAAGILARRKEKGPEPACRVKAVK